MKLEIEEQKRINRLLKNLHINIGNASHLHLMKTWVFGTEGFKMGTEDVILSIFQNSYQQQTFD